MVAGLEELIRERSRRLPRGEGELRAIRALSNAIFEALIEAWKIDVEDQRVTVDQLGQRFLLEVLEPKELPETSLLGLLRSRLRGLT